MKVAIVGAGIAGGYLARLLQQQGISSDVYEGGYEYSPCGFRSCGWGAPEKIGTYLEAIGLELAEYLLEPMPRMNFDGLVATTPLLTIHKPRLIQDLREGLSIRSRPITEEEIDRYDILVDATGIRRTYLPPCSSDLTLPTLQYRVKVEPAGNRQLQPGVYGNKIPGLGYLWVFPLGQGIYHIGAGGIGLERHETILQQYFHSLSEEFTCSHLCGCSGEIRVASPYYSTPHVVWRERGRSPPQAIIGVGESIGTVSPFTGEGILHSLQCATLLADSWPDEWLYSSRVLSTFSWMRKERETLEYLLSQGKTTGPRLRDRWRFYLNAHRSGIGLPMREAFQRMGSLTQWIMDEE